MSHAITELPKNNVWKRSDGRYYRTFEQRTLFGFASLVCCWGSLTSRLGNFKVIHCDDSADLHQALLTIYKTRKAHGYMICQSDHSP